MWGISTLAWSYGYRGAVESIICVLFLIHVFIAFTGSSQLNGFLLFFSIILLFWYVRAVD